MHIEPSTFDFLKSLKENNDRNWFQENKTIYLQSLENVKIVIQDCLHRLSAEDPFLPANLPVQSTLFRIYRDSRFSHDKTPYKTWFGAAMGPEGRKTPGPVYYMHLEPDRSFLALGYWRPEKPDLQAIRQEIDYDLENFEAILHEVQQKGWSGLDSEDKLKKAPKPFTSDNIGIEHLKNKSFTISMSITNEQCIDPNFTQWVVDQFFNAKSFKLFIHQALGGEADLSHTDGRSIL